MRIDRILEEQRPVFSFEFFPPKTDDGQVMLEGTLAELKEDRPEYVSVTYGAGGSTRERTVEITKWIKQDLGIEAMAHLSCVGEPKGRLSEILGELRGVGIDNELYLEFVAEAPGAGITVPIIPGIMPVTSFNPIKTLTGMCGPTTPAD